MVYLFEKEKEMQSTLHQHHIRPRRHNHHSDSSPKAVEETGGSR